MAEKQQKLEKSDASKFLTTVVLPGFAIIGGLAIIFVFVLYPILDRRFQEMNQQRITTNRTRPLKYNTADPDAKQLAEAIQVLQQQYGQTVNKDAGSITISVLNKNGKLYAGHNDVWSGYAYWVNTDDITDPVERGTWLTQTAGPKLAGDLFEKTEPRPVRYIRY